MKQEIIPPPMQIISPTRNCLGFPVAPVYDPSCFSRSWPASAQTDTPPSMTSTPDQSKRLYKRDLGLVNHGMSEPKAPLSPATRLKAKPIPTSFTPSPKHADPQPHPSPKRAVEMRLRAGEVANTSPRCGTV